MYIKCLSIALVIQLNSSPLFIDLDVSQDWGLTVIIAKMDKTLYYMIITIIMIIIFLSEPIKQNKYQP